MKKIILLICLSLLIFSCGSENKITYKLENVTVVPDSLKQEYRNKELALEKYPNDEYYHSVIILQKDMNEADRKIFDDLMLGIKYE